jgi:hypothetical protein
LPEEGAQSPFEPVSRYRCGNTFFPGHNTDSADIQSAGRMVKNQVAGNEFPALKYRVEVPFPG